jgi:protein associated with RNAse G/E
VEENKPTRAGDEIVVRVLNDEGHERRRWSARIAKQDGPLVILDAVFEEEIQHDLLGRIASGTISKEYYWLDRWYNVFRFDERFYCNVTKPPSFDGSILTYVDLDIDVLVESDFSYRILDLEDFEARSYPAEVQQNARNALDEVISLVESKAYPFDE